MKGEKEVDQPNKKSHHCSQSISTGVILPLDVGGLILPLDSISHEAGLDFTMEEESTYRPIDDR
jgi:hypothetical protein